MLLERCENPGYFNGVIVGCGKCIVCKNTKRNEWSVRLEHELLENNGRGVFVTLTYDNEHLLVTGTKPIVNGDECGTLNKCDVQNFMKRLRKRLKNTKIKYIIAGEYGTAFKRPHYHCILIGIDQWTLTQEEWEKIWAKGKVDVDKRRIGAGCINYIHSYIKKDSFLTREDKINFEKEYNRVAPFILQSQGIGKKWAMEHVAGWSKSMRITYNGHRVSVPRYYIKIIKKDEGKVIKINRKLTNIYKNEKEEREYTYYKVIENVNGKYTKEIIKNCKKALEKTVEKLKKEKKLENIDILMKEFNERISKKQKIYEDTSKIPNQELYILKKKPLSKEQVIKRNETSIIKIFGKNTKFYTSKGKQKNYEINLKIEATKKPYSKLEKEKYIKIKLQILDKTQKSNYNHSEINIEEIGGIKKHEYW